VCVRPKATQVFSQAGVVEWQPERHLAVYARTMEQVSSQGHEQLVG
jgi:hypothetical protein